MFLCPFYSFITQVGADEIGYLYRQAGTLLDANNYTEAIFIYKKILERGPDLEGQMKSRLLNNLGYCHYKLNDLESALDYYRQALAVDEKYPTCLNNCAAVLMNQKKYDAALPSLLQAYQLDPKNIKVVFNLLVVHLNLKNKEESLRFVKEAFALDEHYTESRLKKNRIKDEDISKLKQYLRKMDEQRNCPR